MWLYALTGQNEARNYFAKGFSMIKQIIEFLAVQSGKLSTDSLERPVQGLQELFKTEGNSVGKKQT